MIVVDGTVPIKTYYIIRILCIIGIAILIFISGKEMYDTRNYQCIQAKINNIHKEVDLGIENNSKTTVAKYIDYQYNVNGKEYITTQRTFITFGKKVGDTVKIYYSMSDPHQIRSSFKLETCTIGLILAVFFLIAICKMIGVINNEK